MRFLDGTYSPLNFKVARAWPLDATPTRAGRSRTAEVDRCPYLRRLGDLADCGRASIPCSLCVTSDPGLFLFYPVPGYTSACACASCTAWPTANRAATCRSTVMERFVPQAFLPVFRVSPASHFSQGKRRHECRATQRQAPAVPPTGRIFSHLLMERFLGRARSSRRAKKLEFSSTSVWTASPEKRAGTSAKL